MIAPRNTRARLLVISVIATVGDIVGHMLGPRLSYEHASAIFKQRALFLPLISLLLFAVMLVLAVLFARVELRLPGRGVAKGLRFALPFGLLFLFGVVELCLLQGSSLAQYQPSSVRCQLPLQYGRQSASTRDGLQQRP